MSKAKRRHPARTSPSPRRWRRIRSSGLRGITGLAEFRQTQDGGADIRWDRAGRRVTAVVTAEELSAGRGLKDTRSPRPTKDQTDAFDRELDLLIALVREDLSRKAPRGASAKVAAISRDVACAAQEVFLYLDRRLAPSGAPAAIQAAWGEPPKWLHALAKQAELKGHTVARGHGQLDPVSMAAYAIAEHSGIDWKAVGLKCPIDAGVIDREYFQKQYLSGPDIVTADGWSLAHRVLEQVDPSFGREREPLDPKRLPKWAQVQREHFHRQMDRLKAKAEIFGSKSDALKQQYPDLAAEIEGGGQHPDPPHDSSS